MRRPLPAWALKTAAPGDRNDALRAHQRGLLMTSWDRHPDAPSVNYANRPLLDGPPRGWAKAHGWPTPLLSFASSFLSALLASDESFDLAVRDSGVELYFPRAKYVLPAADLHALDESYTERSADGRPVGWRSLVEWLREIRRAVEAGVVVEVEGRALRDFGSFYDWAHGRYHMLEDGADPWIGHDVG